MHAQEISLGHLQDYACSKLAYVIFRTKNLAVALFLGLSFCHDCIGLNTEGRCHDCRCGDTGIRDGIRSILRQELPVAGFQRKVQRKSR